MRFVEIYQSVQSRAGSDDADLLVMIKREINNGLRDIQRRIPDGYWRKATRVYQTLAEVSDGTVTLAGTNVVSKADGTSGTWKTRHQHAYFQRTDDREWYRVARWVSATELHLEHPYLGAGGSSLGYKLLKAEYVLPGDFVKLDGAVQVETPERLYPLDKWNVGFRLPDVVNHGHIGTPIAYWMTDPTRVANYSTGTIDAATQGSRQIDGTGTLWADPGVDFAGQTLRLDSENDPYIIDYVANNGQLQLKEPYLGATFSGETKTYQVNPPGLQKMHLYPLPSTAIMVRFDYFRRLPTLIADDQQPAIPDDYHDLLQYYAESRVLRHIGMDSESRDAKRDYEEKVADLETDGQDRESDRVGRLGSRGDGYGSNHDAPMFRLPGNYEHFGY